MQNLPLQKFEEKSEINFFLQDIIVYNLGIEYKNPDNNERNCS